MQWRGNTGERIDSPYMAMGGNDRALYAMEDGVTVATRTLNVRARLTAEIGNDARRAFHRIGYHVDFTNAIRHARIALTTYFR